MIFTAASIDRKDVYSTAVDDTKKIITFETSELKTLNQTSILTYEVTNNSSNYDANVTVTCVSKDGTTAKFTSIKNELENNTIKILAKNSATGTSKLLDYYKKKLVTMENYSLVIKNITKVIFGGGFVRLILLIIIASL